ncbi:type VII secretion-associated serine protease [Streptomyces sp. NE5-10]|uniref:S8 family serine peptidase n=1 Tax=Streptomyces sp. NE5-10 TaxID=2759674 RepID=UPI001A5D6DAF|nr:S8 family serine peptidase [Streptomyces sp. NE5-10]GHJ94363.1 type VII secretion-associated serine protease [Streptomyces sp. NE5-10]
MIESGRLRRAFLGTTAIAVLTTSLVGVAPTAVAADARSQQWYLDAMKAEEIWKKTTGKGITVAVIDSGVDPDTPSLKGKVLKGWDASESKGEETDDYSGHGTSIAEVIVGSGAGGGIRGLAPDARVIPYRVADTERQNEQAVNAFDMEESIKAAADSDAKIINVSVASDYYNEGIREAVKYAQGKGKLVFAGAGNNATKGNKPQYPASYPEAVAVAASDRDGSVAEYSQHGDTIDIAAPGTDVPGYCDKSLAKYCLSEGTSFSTAIASASAALIWSMHPDWTGNQVLRVMLDSAARGDGWEPGTVSDFLGHGIVRPNAHVSRGEGDPGDANINPLTKKPTGGATGAAPSATASGPGSSGTSTTAPSATASTQAPDGEQTSGAPVAGSTESAAAEADGGSSTGLVIGIAAAAVVVLAGAGFVLARRRRSA